MLRLATLGKLSFFGRIGQPYHFLLQGLHDDGDVVDSHLHLFVVTLVVLLDEFVDLPARDLRQNPVPFPDWQQDRIQHCVHAFHHVVVRALELFGSGTFGQTTLLGRFDQAHDLLRNQQRGRVFAGKRAVPPGSVGLRFSDCSSCCHSFISLKLRTEY